jgi:hypothetical protein
VAEIKSEYGLHDGQRTVITENKSYKADNTENTNSAGDSAVPVTAEDAALAFGAIYNDGTYKYFGEAAAGTATTASSWRVSRMTIATSQIQWVDSGNFSQVYNVKADIIALTYV